MIAVERNKKRLEMARHNAKIYGVAHKISFVYGDVLAREASAGFVFADPPWDLGMEFLQQVQRWAMEQFTSGMLKLPVAMPLPANANIRVICTAEGYPSFILRCW